MTFSRKNVDIFIRNFVVLYWFICADVENDSLLDNAPTNYEVGCVIQRYCLQHGMELDAKGPQSEP